MQNNSIPSSEKNPLTYTEALIQCSFVILTAFVFGSGLWSFMAMISGLAETGIMSGCCRHWLTAVGIF